MIDGKSDYRATLKRAGKFLFLAATAGVTFAGAYAYIEYRKARLAQEAARLWDLLGLRPGARVGDIGAGTGEVAAHMAQQLGDAGRVYAVEVDGGKLRALRRRQGKLGYNNLEVVEGSSRACNLAAGSCDSIYLRGAYHHFTDPDAMNASLFRALRPGGTLALIEFPPRLLLSLWTPKGIPDNRGGHGIRREMVIHELERAGFDPVRTISDWPGQRYCVVMQKPIAV